MSVKLMSEAVEKLNSIGCNCQTYSAASGAQDFAVHSGFGAFISFNNFTDHTAEQFDFRLQMIIKHGLFWRK